MHGGEGDGLRPPRGIRAFREETVDERVGEVSARGELVPQLGDRVDPVRPPCGAAAVHRCLGGSRHVLDAEGGELAQDTLTADIDDDDPELGHFSPWSWWPLALAFGLAFVFTGLAVGPWVSFIGGPIVLIAIVGWNYEYYRNHFAR